MTTIAFDGKTLATDTLITTGDVKFGYLDKIFILNDGRVLAGAGDVPYIEAIVDWLNGGDKPTKTENEGCNCILIDPSTKIAKELNSDLRWMRAVIPWAGGTGQSYALAAMACGKDAIGAVEIACKIDVWSGGEIKSWQLPTSS